MSKRGLPSGIQMRHDSHYVEELARSYRSIGKIIPIGKIAPNPKQPRTDVGDLTELTDSIRQNGVLEPLLVKPLGDGSWMIIAGERRWRSAGLAGLTEVPCIEFDIDERAVAEIALIENLQRKDLTIWEEADGLAHLSRQFEYTQDEIAKKIGKSRTTITELMTIANLPSEIREKCLRADLTAKSTLLEIARQFDETAMHQLLENIGDKNLKREDIRRQSRRQKNPSEENIIPKNFSGKSVSEKFEKSDKTFNFDAPNGEFTLKLKFEDNSAFTDRDVLKALKQTFDSVKRRVNDTNVT